jgi:hypothetical protein
MFFRSIIVVDSSNLLEFSSQPFVTIQINLQKTISPHRQYHIHFILGVSRIASRQKQRLYFSAPAVPANTSELRGISSPTPDVVGKKIFLSQVPTP